MLLFIEETKGEVNVHLDGTFSLNLDFSKILTPMSDKLRTVIMAVHPLVKTTEEQVGLLSFDAYQKLCNFAYP